MDPSGEREEVLDGAPPSADFGGQAWKYVEVVPTVK